MSQKFTHAAARFIFWSRWLQLPMYMGLIVALAVYVYKFFVTLSGLILSNGDSGVSVTPTITPINSRLPKGTLIRAPICGV